MSVCITASCLMTAAEVRKQCKKAMESESLLMALELEIKHRYLKLKKYKAALSA